MEVSEAGRKLIAGFEGCRLEAYKDIVGVWTIGYGHTEGVSAGQKITQEEADGLLAKDLDLFANGVEKLLTRVPTQAQFDAMVSLAFNIGLSGFKGSSILKYFNAGQDSKAAEYFLKWNKAGGKIVSGLVRRRAAEAELYLSTSSVTEKEPKEMNWTDYLNKTNLTAVGAIIAAIIAFATGTIGVPELVAAIWAAVQTMNIRHAITKTEKSVANKVEK